MMRYSLVLLMVLLAAAFSSGAEEGFTPIFNGKDLSGWEGKPGGWWVEDGALTSESTEAKPCVKHHYLFWKDGKPGDFVLRFKFKLMGGNSGVQFRSEPRPDFDVWGYQADMDDTGQWTGSLFQHDRGGVVMRGFKSIIAPDGAKQEVPIAKPEDLLKVYKVNDWNEYEVAATGNNIQLRINGVLMCEVDDQDAKYSRKDGVIALQMHPGPPMKVQFKDIRIRVMDKK